MSTLALILGRAGSKGVPGKNTADIAGRPCIEWTIDAALEAIGVDRVALSTDCPVMQRIGAARGIEVIERPADLACDHTTVDAAARHAVDELNDARIVNVCMLYANVPVRPPGVVDRVMTMLETTGADSVQTYQPVGKYHPWWMARVDADGVVTPWEGDVLNHGVFRRQDLPPALIPDGAVLAVTRPALYLEIPGVTPGPHAFFGRERRGVVNPEGTVIDIDAPEDLAVARAFLESQELPCASEAASSAPTNRPTSSRKSV